jgi:transposase
MFSIKEFYENQYISVEFYDKYIKPIIPKPKRGYESKISGYALINIMMHVLKSGCRWKDINRQRVSGHYVKSYSTVYYHFKKWSKKGLFRTLYEKTRIVDDIQCVYDGEVKDNKYLLLLLDSSHFRGNLGQECVEFGYKKMKSTKIHALTDDKNNIYEIFNFEAGNNNDMSNLKNADAVLEKYSKTDKRQFLLLADSGYDSKELRNICDKHGIKYIISKNNRNSKKAKNDISILHKLLYNRRMCIEKTFSWFKSFRGLLNRFDTTLESWMSRIFLVASYLNMKRIA